MSAKVISNAKLTVLAAVLAAAGALLSTGGCNIFIAASLSVASLMALIFCANAKDLNMPGGGCLFVVASVPLFFFVYAQARQHKPVESDLSQYAGREVIFTAKICRCDNDAAKTNSAASSMTPRWDPARTDSSMTPLLDPNRTDSSMAPSSVVGSANVSRFTPDAQDVKDIQTHPRHDVILEPQELLFRRDALLQAKRSFVSISHYQLKPIETYFCLSALLFKLRTNRSIHGITIALNNSQRKMSTAFAIQGEPATKLSLRYKSCADSSKSQARSTSWADAFNVLEYQYEQSMVAARSTIVDAHRKCLPVDLADLLSSMVLGNRAVTLPETMTSKFRDLGLSHVLAASGFNLTIVTAMSFWFCRLVTPSTFIANSVCFLAMLGFVALAGPSPSVLRAALMCSFMLAARCSQRSLSVSSVIAAAFLITVTIDPQCTSDLGLQLSYGATIGIVFGAHAFSRFIYRGESRWRRALADVFAVVSIAQASVMPIQLYCFWKTGTLFLPANLMVSPLITPVTVLGFAASLVSLLQCIHAGGSLLENIIAVIDAFAFIPLAMMYSMVDFMSSFQAAKLSLGQPSLPGILTYYSALLAWFLALRTEKHRTIAFGSLLIGVCALLFRQPPPPLTVALLNSQVVLVDGNCQALQENGPSKSDKLVERFLAFKAAQVHPSAFSIIAANGDWTLIDVHQQFYVLVLRKISEGKEVPSNLCNLNVGPTKILVVADQLNHGRTGVLSKLVFSWKPDRIIIFASDKAAHLRGALDVGASGYQQCSDEKVPQVKIVGSGSVNAIMLCREQHKSKME